MCRLATQLAGEEHVRDTWYDVRSSDDVRILMDAVRAALVADLIVGSGEPQDPQSSRTRDYLQAVARKAQLDFIPLFESRLHGEVLNSEV